MKQSKVTILSILFIFALQLVAYAGTAYTTDALNVRENPSTSAKKIATVPKGTKIDVIEDAGNGWTKISYNGSVCFVKSEYLTAAKQENSSTQATETNNAVATTNGSAVTLNPNWKYADCSAINSGAAVLYKATANRKNKVIGVNAGHGTKGGTSVKTYCHPDKTPKVTGGSTAAGSTKATAVSSGMSFSDGTLEPVVTLKEAQFLRDILLSRGYDVLMLRDGDDVQLDNVARTVICNNAADCHIAIHWDGDGLSYDKGCFYSSVPDGIKYLETVAQTWEKSEKLGNCLIKGLSDNGAKINGAGSMDIDLTQTSYSTVPSVDIELGNQKSDHSDAQLQKLATGLADGVDAFFK